MIQSANNRLLCRPLEIEQKKGALILTSEKKQHQIALVVSIGPDSETSAHVGDIVYAHRNSGLIVEHNDMTYVSFRDDELIAIEHKSIED